MRSTKFNLPFPMHNKYQMSNRELPNFFLQIERLPLFLPIYQLPSTHVRLFELDTIANSFEKGTT